MPLNRLALLSGAATAAAITVLGAPAPAAAQGWVSAKPLARSNPYVAGDMHNHTTCTDGVGLDQLPARPVAWRRDQQRGGELQH